MPALNDECVLNVDGFVSFNPAQSLRAHARKFVASRPWSTKEVFYGDQLEPTEESAEQERDEPLWSFCFCLGLDHIPDSNGDWRDDVGALVGFLQEISSETGREILMEVRWRSKPWYSEHIAYVDDKTPDLTTICAMIERVAKRGAKPWWRVW
jgi:hypothetical protein